MLPLFFLLSFMIAWSAWYLAFTMHLPLIVFGAFAPAMAALIVSYVQDREKGIANLLSALARTPSNIWLWAFAVGYTPALKLLAAVVYRFANRAWPPFGSESWFVIVAAVGFGAIFQVGEELGWRGYLLPALEKHMRLSTASLLLGVIWALWHLPFFVLPSSPMYKESLPDFIVQVVLLSVAFAWLYWRSGRSLLLVMLLHSSFNNSKDIVVGLPIRYITLAGMALVAVVLFFDMRLHEDQHRRAARALSGALEP